MAGNPGDLSSARGSIEGKYTGEDFAFPFEPYDIQLDLMRAVYSTMECGCVGIMESPTGTGKSLSLLCAAAKWLQDVEKSRKLELKKAITGCEDQIKNLSVCDDWIRAQTELLAVREKRDKLEDQLKALTQLESEINDTRLRIRQSDKNIGGARKRPFNKQTMAGSDRENEQKSPEKDFEPILDEALAPPIDFEIHSEASKSEFTENDDIPPPLKEQAQCTQILYASRTHSQLAQFVGELHKSPKWAESLRTVVIGSRQMLCANPAVRNLGGAINDRCSELRQNSSDGGRKIAKASENGSRPAAGDIEDAASGKKKSCQSKGCPFYNDSRMSHLADIIVCDKAMTPEKMLELGQDLVACPYYAARKAIPRAQMVLMPYQILFNGASRKVWGVKLTSSAVIVDEAHNLLDAIAQTHGCEISLAQCQGALTQLNAYISRYRNRLNATSLMYLKQSVMVVSAFLQVMNEATCDQMFKVNEFLIGFCPSDLNLPKLLDYIDQAQICRKLFMFSCSRLPLKSDDRNSDDKMVKRKNALAQLLRGKSAEVNLDGKVPENVKTARDTLPQGSPLYAIHDLMRCLCESNDDVGRILLTKSTESDSGNEKPRSNSSLRYLPLDSSSHLAPLVNETKSLILAGGTMKPAAELQLALEKCQQMDPLEVGRAEKDTRWFSCGHVVGRERICALVLKSGPAGQQLKFNFERRSDRGLISQLGTAVLNISRLVRGGTVVFFPSYDYMTLVLKVWNEVGLTAQIVKRVPLFQETRGECDSLLRQYSRCIANKGSALICAVVGGKLSEGINFGDDLGRCVIMVGLPYPKRDSPQMREKLAYLNSIGGASLSAQCYDNACIKAVNQCIGRVIRHKNDYAAVMDERYSEPRISGSLPKWLMRDVQVPESFGRAVPLLAKFFGGLRADQKCD